VALGYLQGPHDEWQSAPKILKLIIFRTGVAEHFCTGLSAKPNQAKL